MKNPLKNSLWNKGTGTGLIPKTLYLDDAPHGIDASGSKHKQTWRLANVTQNIVLSNRRGLKKAKKKQ